MEETRMIYEHLTRAAFNVENRKDLWFADADFYNSGKVEVVWAFIVSAVSILAKNHNGLEQYLERLSSIEKSVSFSKLDQMLKDIENEFHF